MWGIYSGIFGISLNQVMLQILSVSTLKIIYFLNNQLYIFMIKLNKAVESEGSTSLIG